MTDRQPEYGSDLIVELFKAFEIEYAALNPGATFRGIHDSIVNYGGNRNPEVIECCHEEISVAIAHGYAKAAGKPMIAIVHNIVGLQHASMAIFNAWCDRVPVLVLGGTGPMDITKRRAWIDWIHTALVQGNLVRDFVKWDDQPHTLSSVPESLIRAYRIAMTEPKGPVYLCYDAELQEMEYSEDGSIPNVGRFRPPSPIQADSQAIEAAVELLTEANDPVLIADLVGRSPGAVADLTELAELLGVPVIDRGHRLNFPSVHPMDLTDVATDLLSRADLVFGLDVVDLFGSLSTVNRVTRISTPIVRPDAKIVHITLGDLSVRSWASDYQRLHPVDLPIAADTSVALPAIVRLCKEKIQSKPERVACYQQRFESWKEIHNQARRAWWEEALRRSDEVPISVPKLALDLWEVIRDEDWVLVNGNLNGWARKVWDWTHPDQYLGTSGGGGVGYGAGAALGAALAHRKTGRLCVDIQPDGDLLYTSSALWTAAHHCIPLLMVVHNNRSYYNSEEHGIQIAKARRRPVERAGIGTRIDDPPVNFAKLAEAYGLFGFGPIEEPKKLKQTLKEALRIVKEKRCLALVDVVSQPR
jgi:thiamine pyrophosphate-dependent acetolactate synthase large subunit-like protein